MLSEVAGKEHFPFARYPNRIPFKAANGSNEVGYEKEKQNNSPFAQYPNRIPFKAANGSNEVGYEKGKTKQLSVCPTSEQYFN